MIIKFPRLILLIGLVLLFVSIKPAISLEVSGDVSGTWGPEDNPYLVVGDLRVPPSQSLNIRPGCQIEFQGHYKFIVDTLAILRAVGTETDSIIFTDEDTLVGWHGIRYLWADSTCEIAYCRLEWGRAVGLHPNDTLSMGGSIFILGTSLTVRNSHLHFNRAWEGNGGAIFADQSNLLVSESILDSNTCSWGGSAIYATNSNVLIKNNLISHDSTWYPLGGERGGGAIGCIYSTVQIRNNIITNNFCGYYGGGIYITYSNALVTDNIIRDNKCGYYGAGICVGAVALVINNLIYQNSVVRFNQTAGGGIACGDSVTLRNNTVVDNYCPNLGGGIYCWAPVPSNTFENNIIWGNIAYLDSQMTFAGQRPVIIYNDIQGGFSGEGNINADPLFMGPDDFHLSWADFPLDDSTKSPCIDSGDPASPYDSDGTRADMGAIPFDRRTYGIEDNSGPPIGDYILIYSYPNPFNAQTTIRYLLPSGQPVTLIIYDILGRKIAAPFEGFQPAGEHTFTWDASAYSSGLYYASLKAGDHSLTTKLILLK